MSNQENIIRLSKELLTLAEQVNSRIDAVDDFLKQQVMQLYVEVLVIDPDTQYQYGVLSYDKLDGVWCLSFQRTQYCKTRPLKNMSLVIRARSVPYLDVLLQWYEDELQKQLKITKEALKLEE